MKYEEMKLEVIVFEQQDVIVTSGGEGQQGGYEGPPVELE